MKYKIDPTDAQLLAGMTVADHDDRVALMTKFFAERGTVGVIDLFSQFIGLSMSVSENTQEAVELVLITTGDWHPHAAEKINIPSIQGALLGVGVAASIAKDAGACGGCAYRLGSIANQCASTVLDCNSTVENGDKFYCHEKLDSDGAINTLCVGHARRAKAMASQP